MSQDLYLAHVDAGVRVLAAWFDHEHFRAAWKPLPDLFADEQQRACATVMALLGPRIDLDGLIVGLQRQGTLKHFASATEVYELILGRPFEVDPWRALERLREAAALRALRRSLQNALRELEGGVTLADARKLTSEALKSADVASGTKALTVQQLLLAAQKQATRPDRELGLRTISKQIDRATGGIRREMVWLVAASTSWGKTSMLCAIVDQALRAGKRALIVSAEDPPVLYGQRLLQVRTRVNALRLREARLERTELQDIMTEVQQAPKDPCFLDARGRSAEAIAADIQSLVASEGISVVLVDYVQALHTKTTTQDPRNRINHCARLCIDAIKGSGAGGILFSQLTEDASSGKRRARESEDLHAFAEVVLFGFTEREKDTDAQGHEVEVDRKRLWVEKVKDGPAKFRVELKWDSDAACFVSDYDNLRAARELFSDGSNPED